MRLALGVCFRISSNACTPAQIAVFLATTRLVGMECPGLHSIFSELDVRFTLEKDATGPLHYSVQRFDPRFGALTLGLSGAGVLGTIKAFVRPSPHAQPDVSRLTSVVKAKEFTGQHALIIGGSRGLGEVSAKLLAAGDAGVTLTYHRGADDAQRVVGEIVAAGGRATALPFDVLSPDNVRPDHWPGDVPHIYIFRDAGNHGRLPGAFQPVLFKQVLRLLRDWFGSCAGRHSAARPPLRWESSIRPQS